MSSVVRALGFFTCELNSRPTSECDCAFFIKKLKMIFSPGRLPCSPPAWPPRTTARAPSTPSRTVFLWWFAIFLDLPPSCTTLSRWRTWTAAWRRSRTATARAAMERQATMSATQDPVWLDGFNNWVCFNSYGLLWSFTMSPDQECPQSSNARWARPLLRSATRRPQIQTGTKSQRIAVMSPSGMNRCGGYLKKVNNRNQPTMPNIPHLWLTKLSLRSLGPLAPSLINHRAVEHIITWR